MKVYLPNAPESLLEHRVRTGADRWDEMWEGVLHMPPPPNRSQQDLEGALETWLRTHWQPRSQGRVYHQINVTPPGGWPDSYRIPDLVLLTPDRLDIDRDVYFEGPPAVVVEIHSPDDESYEKLPFYAQLGVPETWIVDRTTKAAEIFTLAGPQYVKLAPDREGWLFSETTGIELRGGEGRLGIRLRDDPATHAFLPNP